MPHDTTRTGFQPIPGQPVSRYVEETAFDEPRFQQLTSQQFEGYQRPFQRQRESIQSLFRRRGLGAGSGLEAQALAQLGGEQTGALQRGALSVFQTLQNAQQGARERTLRAFQGGEGALTMMRNQSALQNAQQQSALPAAIGQLAASYYTGGAAGAGGAAGIGKIGSGLRGVGSTVSGGTSAISTGAASGINWLGAQQKRQYGGSQYQRNRFPSAQVY